MTHSVPHSVTRVPMSEYLRKRDGYWYYARRVPTEFVELAGHEKIRVSTKIKVVDDRRGKRAAAVVDELNRAAEQRWRDLVEGRSSEAEARFATARRRARASGFEYVEAADLAARPLDERLARVELLTEQGPDNPEARAALLGTVAKPVILLSKVFDRFEALVRSENVNKSPDQLRVWRNGKKLAIQNFIKAIGGDKPLHEVSDDDALTYRDWKDKEIADKELSPKTGNKEISHLARMFRELSDKNRLGLPDLFAKRRFAGGDEEERPPFETNYVQGVLLGHWSLVDLNPEARRIMYVVADSGLRPSEVCNLTKETIVLDAEIPYVKVRPDGREIKTAPSSRDIPLVGVALAALKAQPRGFPRYRDKGGSLSATLNAFLRSHDLFPTDRHTVYSLRHTFKDRLIEAEAPDSIIDQLMGHREDKPKYGKGASLKLKHKWLQAIAFRPPSKV